MDSNAVERIFIETGRQTIPNRKAMSRSINRHGSGKALSAQTGQRQNSKNQDITVAK